jgi:hypothetical protein
MTRKPLNKTSPAAAFERLLAALEAEILAASDEEIAEVLAERGMKLGMKGSASLGALVDPRDAADAALHDDEGMGDGPVYPPNRCKPTMG